MITAVGRFSFETEHHVGCLDLSSVVAPDGGDGICSTVLFLEKYSEPTDDSYFNSRRQHAGPIVQDSIRSKSLA